MGNGATALVTGGSGFIGSHLVEALLREGFHVRCLVRKTSSLAFLPAAGVEYARGSLEDRAALREAVAGTDWVFHLAGRVKAKRPEEYFQANQQGTRNLLEATAEKAPGIRGFIYLSSLSAAGPSPDGHLLNEQEEPHPVSCYGLSKLAAEKEAVGYAGRFPVVILRPAAVYGPREREIYQFIRAVQRGIRVNLSWRDRRFSIIHVDDVIQAVLFACRNPRPGAAVYFIADGEVYGWQAALRVVGEILRKTTVPVLIPGKLARGLCRAAAELFPASGAAFYIDKIEEMSHKYWVCSIEKAQNELGFKPRFNLRDGLRDTIQWYRNNGWLKKQ